MASKECALAGSKRNKSNLRKNKDRVISHTVAARKCTPLRGEQQATQQRLWRRCKSMGGL